MRAGRGDTRMAGGAVQAYLARQFGNPSGAAGRLAGWIMATRPSNRRRNEWTVDLLDMRPGHRVLEIGFGPGIALGLAARRVGSGLVAGIDRSATMVQLARRRHRALVESGHMDVNIGSVERLGEVLGPSPDAFFDRIFAVNAVMFWQEPATCIRALAAHLAPGGRMAFTFQPRLGDKTDAAAIEAGNRLRKWLEGAGMGNVRVEVLSELSPVAVCVIGDRSPR